jgi:translation initiation factor 2 subunit 1
MRLLLFSESIRKRVRLQILLDPNATFLTGYIDLSKRRVSREDIIKCEERYNKSKMVHSIMRHVAEKTQHPIEDLYETIGWPLNKKYGHAVDAFKLSIT